MQALLEPIKIDTCQSAEPGVRWSGATGDSQHRLLRGYLHKTSNSLCGIKGYASLIAGLGQEAGDNSRWAQKIISEVEKMEMVFASVDAMTAKRRAASLVREPQDVIQSSLFRAQAKYPLLTSSCEKAPLCSLILPEADLEQVLKDILENAAEGAHGQEERVEVEVLWRTNLAGRIALVIRDDAGGIPLHLGSQVRDPFVTAKADHVGIGLSRVETILDMHSLEWSLESDHGHGTTVTMEVATPTAVGVAMAGKASDGA